MAMNEIFLSLCKLDLKTYIRELQAVSQTSMNYQNTKCDGTVYRAVNKGTLKGGGRILWFSRLLNQQAVRGYQTDEPRTQNSAVLHCREDTFKPIGFETQPNSFLSIYSSLGELFIDGRWAPPARTPNTNCRKAKQMKRTKADRWAWPPVSWNLCKGRPMSAEKTRLKAERFTSCSRRIWSRPGTDSDEIPEAYMQRSIADNRVLMYKSLIADTRRNLSYTVTNSRPNLLKHLTWIRP